VLFDRISHSIEILFFFYGSTIVNTNNDITYNRRSNGFLTVIFDMTLTKLFIMLCNQVGWNLFEIEVDSIGQTTP